MATASSGAGRRSGRTFVAQALLRLVHVSGIEPEGAVLGDESAGAFADPALADDQGLTSFDQGPADLRPIP